MKNNVPLKADFVLLDSGYAEPALGVQARNDGLPFDSKLISASS